MVSIGHSTCRERGWVVRAVTSATIRDVAEAADVSVATVSRTLNDAGKVTPHTRERVLAAAKRLDYVPHSGARSLASKRTDTLGVLLPDLHGEFFSELIRGIDAASRGLGLHLLLSHSHGDMAEAVGTIRALRSRVDGLIVMSPYADEAALSAAAGGAVPLILLAGAGREGNHCRIEVDNRAGAIALTNHLLAVGRRRIAFIAGPGDNLEAEQRLAGYRAALTAARLPAGPIAQGRFCERSGWEAANVLLRNDRPDAIFAANDMMAIGALQALRARGISVPGDIALAGFDDIPVARFLDPPLTTVAVPIAEIGRCAVETAMTVIDGRPAQRRIFAPRLKIRKSTVEQSETYQLLGEDRHHVDIVIG